MSFLSALGKAAASAKEDNEVKADKKPIIIYGIALVIFIIIAIRIIKGK
jgi:t-SNARE complex subunit (syntaxin)